MKKLIIIIALVIIHLSDAFTQNVDDALRYSQSFYIGTARFMSMGGAFTALGGDLSTLSQNPAGLGVFRSSEISFSPQVLYVKNSAAFSGTATDYNYNFNLGQAGIVSHLISGKGPTGLISLNIGYSFNKINNLTSPVRIQGKSMNSSMIDAWADQSYGYYKDELSDYAPYGYMAYKVYLIDTLSFSDIEYGTVYSNYGDNFPSVYGQNLRRVITNEGYTGEHAFSIGGNYSDKFFFGATIGVNRLKFTDQYEHYEETNTNLISGFEHFNYTTLSDNTGTGISFKAGAIFKPVESLRIGVAFHSPTFYWINSYLYDDIEAKFQGYNPDQFTYEPLRYKFALQTPFRALAGIAYQIKKFALLSVDYEFVDYSSARFSETGDNYDYTDKNNEIKNSLRQTSNLRFGGELRFNKLYLRSGVAYYGKPYSESDINGIMDYTSLSFGAGLREQNIYIDFGFTNLKNSQKYTLYSLYSDTAPNHLKPVTASLNTTRNIFAVTLGYKFGY